MANPKMYKLVTSEYDVIGSIESFYEEMQTLAEEAREIVDNAPESLQSSPRNLTLSETADILERLEAPDPPHVPEGVAAPKKSMHSGVYVPRRRSDAISRAQRCANAAMLAGEAVAVLREWLEPFEVEDEEPTWVDEWRHFLDTIQDNIEEADGVEFPGMRG